MQKIIVSFLIGMLAIGAEAAFNDQDIAALKEELSAFNPGGGGARVRGRGWATAKRFDPAVGERLMMAHVTSNRAAFLEQARKYFESVGGGVHARRGQEGGDEATRAAEAEAEALHRQQQAQADRDPQAREEEARRQQQAAQAQEERERREAARKEEERLHREEIERQQREAQAEKARIKAEREAKERAERDRQEAARKAEEEQARKKAAEEQAAAAAARKPASQPAPEEALTSAQRKNRLKDIFLEVLGQEGKPTDAQQKAISKYSEGFSAEDVKECREDAEAKIKFRKVAAAAQQQARADEEEAERRKAETMAKAPAARQAIREEERNRFQRALDVRNDLTATQTAYERALADLERRLAVAHARAQTQLTYPLLDAAGNHLTDPITDEPLWIGGGPLYDDWIRLGKELAALKDERERKRQESLAVIHVVEDLHDRRTRETAEDKKIRDKYNPQTFEILLRLPSGALVGQFLIPVEQNGTTYKYVVVHPDRVANIRDRNNVYIANRILKKGAEALLDGVDETIKRVYDIGTGNTCMGLNIE